MNTRTATTIVHAAGEHSAGGVSPALHQSSVYAAKSVAHAVELEEMTFGHSSYTRVSNPTVRAFERAMATIEDGDEALATPSGMGALSLVFLALLEKRDRVVASPHSYTDTLTLLQELSWKIGFELVLADLCDASEVTRIRPTMVVLESPTNPMLRIADIKDIAGRLRETGGLLVVDGTLGTPVNQRPLALGADLVVHSASKYLSGHYNAIAGVVVGSAALIEKMHHFRTMSGLCLDPHSAWLLLQGLQTLFVRVRAQNDSGRRVAEFLAAHPDVEFVAYPGLPSSPGHEIAAAQMSGFGGVIAFGPALAQDRLTLFLESVKLCTLAVSLGGTRTLIESPALMSHAQGGPEHESLTHVPPNTIRLSVGLEDPQDIIDDLEQALREARGL